MTLPQVRRGGPAVGPRLVIIEGPGAGIARDIGSAPVMLGRDPSCGLQILDEKASRRHCVVARRDDAYWVEDLGSRNGFAVNERVVTRASLSDGDRIRIGSTVVAFECPVLSDRAPSLEGLRNVEVVGDPSMTIVVSSPEVPEPIMATAMAPGDSGFIDVGTLGGDDGTLRSISERLASLLEINKAISSLEDPSILVDRILGGIFDVVSATRGIIFVTDEEGRLVPAAQRSNLPAGEVETFKISQTLLNRIVYERVAILATDLSTDERFDGSKSIVASGARSSLTVPLLYKDEIRGVVHLDSDATVGAFGEQDLRFVSSVAGQAAVALENVRLLKQVADEAEARSNLGRYLPPELVEQVLHSGGSLSMDGQETVATVLFSDLRGFTAMSERMPPVEILRTLNEYLELMVDVITDHGGAVDKFMGDAIMAVWGVPRAGEDDAGRAVMAAIRMQQVLYQYNQRRSEAGLEPLTMGVGINTGTVLAGNVGSSKRLQFTVIGDNVNLASRLEGLTSSYQVFVSRSTYDRVRERVQARALDAVRVKGKAEAVEVFEIRGLVDDRTSELGRRHERIRCALKTAVVAMPCKSTHLGLITNLSPGGAGLQMLPSQLGALVAGTRLVLAFKPYDDERIVLRGELMRVSDETDRRGKPFHKLGIRFDEDETKMEDILLRIVEHGTGQGEHAALDEGETAS